MQIHGDVYRNEYDKQNRLEEIIKEHVGPARWAQIYSQHLELGKIMDTSDPTTVDTDLNAQRDNRLNWCEYCTNGESASQCYKDYNSLNDWDKNYGKPPSGFAQCEDVDENFDSSLQPNYYLPHPHNYRPKLPSAITENGVSPTWQSESNKRVKATI
jgi:hypothetical protein